LFVFKNYFDIHVTVCDADLADRTKATVELLAWLSSVCPFVCPSVRPSVCNVYLG